MQTPGQNIKRLRKERGLTQQQLADQTGVSRVTVNKIENDRCISGYVYVLAKALGVKPKDIVTSEIREKAEKSILKKLKKLGTLDMLLLDKYWARKVNS